MNLTFRQYRTLDIIVFTVILCLFESILTVVWNLLFVGDPFIPSVAFLILALMYMRWGIFGLVSAVFCGLISTTVSILTDKTADQTLYFINIVGYLFSASIVLYTNKLGKSKIRDSWFKTLLYATVLYLIINVGKSLAYLIVQKNFIDTFSYFMTQTFLRGLIAYAIMVVGVLISRNINGLFEDQKTYLFRTQRERENK